MAEKIVQRLQEVIKVKYGARVNVERELLTQAADAIEELSILIKGMEMPAEEGET